MTTQRRQFLDWLVPGRVAACAYPRSEEELALLAGAGVGLLINLHVSPHDPATLARHGLTELHLPVPDYTPPALRQLARGVAALEDALAAGQGVAVHCGAGLGRTGTLLACYLVGRGLTADEAIARVRAARPGAIETPDQEETVRMWERENVGA